MIYFLFGDDSFRSREKLNSILCEYRKKRGAAPDILEFDAETGDWERLSLFGKSQSLFETKKAIVIRRPSLGGEEFLKKLKKMLTQWEDSTDTLVFFWDDGERQAMGKVKKALEKHQAKMQEFWQFNRGEAERWLSEYARGNELNIKENDIRLLAERFYPNTWQLAREAEKVSLGGEMGDPLFGEAEKVFGFLDAVFLSPEKALFLLQKLEDGGAEEMQVWGSLISHLRTLLVLAEGGVPEVHPFVLKKAREKMRLLRAVSLRPLYEKLFDYEVKIKRSGMKPFEAIRGILIEG